jgi:hypothetical protein
MLMMSWFEDCLVHTARIWFVVSQELFWMKNAAPSGEDAALVFLRSRIWLGPTR